MTIVKGVKMPYIPNTDRDRQAMFAKIGVKDFSELIAAIPEKYRLKGELKLDKPMTELEITEKIQSQTCRNTCTQTANSFLGAGVYDHFIPSAVDAITSRPEFLTAYTPYQAEVSQGTLQFIYEYQTMICELTGMEIANASMYDGATAVAEAILMAVRKNRKKKALLPDSLNPTFKDIVRSYTEGIGIELEYVPMKDGVTDLDALKELMTEDVGSVTVQSPNYFGNLEDVDAISEITHSQKGALLIASVNPISLAILKSPGDYGADIVVGEGQSLGNGQSLGGPLFGFFATKLDMARQMPGRIVGGTVDVDGKRAYALTLQAREQHIRRAKATSNICSNQSLCTLAATVYMSLMGREGLKEAAIQSAQKAHYLASELSKVDGISMKYPDAKFFNEFVIETKCDAQEIVDNLVPRGIYAGVVVGKNQLMLAVTEKKRKAAIDDFVNAIKEVCDV